MLAFILMMVVSRLGTKPGHPPEKRSLAMILPPQYMIVHANVIAKDIIPITRDTIKLLQPVS
jgi:hypothetical protein